MTPDEIKTARIRVFGTQAEAAKHFQVTQSGWCKWEIGTRKMPKFYAKILKEMILIKLLRGG